MVALLAWIAAGVALWFSRSVLDVFDAAGQTTRVAVFPSAPELMGLIVLSLATAAAVWLCVRRWTKSPEDRAAAFQQISLPLFGLVLVVFPYLPWLPDEIGPLQALAGPIVRIIWFAVVGQVVLTFFTIRAGFRPATAVTRGHIFRTILIALVTIFLSWTAASRLQDTLTGVALVSEPPFPGWTVWSVIVLTALTAVLMWRWVVAFTGSPAAATLAWAAIFLSTPLLFTSISSYPDIPAALCVMIALAWRSDPQRAETPWGEYLVRGLALSLLPWLSPTYAPLAAAAAIVLGLRVVRNPRAVLALLVPFTVSLVRWVWAYQPQEFGNPLSGALGLLFDQEFGVLMYSPALVLGLAGLWRMLAAGSTKDVRERGRELAVLFGVLLVSAGALAAWWGGTAPPGRPLVPVLPLLGLPIAWAYHKSPQGSVRRSGYQLLTLLGMAVTVSMLMAEHGALVIQDRDGSSRLLQWITMLWPTWEIAPAVAAFGLRRSAGLIALWIAAGAAVAWIGRRNALRHPGASSLMATMNLSAAVLLVALLAPSIFRSESQLITRPESRSRVAMLDNFDSLARPHAVIYRPFTLAHATDIPPLMALAAETGLRTGDQPVAVFLNARYALAAGEYSVEIGGLHASEPVGGTVGLQVGRIGSPLREWPVELAPGGTWRATFTLPIDAEFVGFVISDSLSTASSLRITPLKIVDKNQRESLFQGPSRVVLSSVGLSSASIFFHDEDVYPERDGFWVHGESTSYMTVASEHPDQGVTVRVNSGAQPNTVTLATTTWGTRIDLKPGTAREVHIPAPARAGPFLLRVTTDRGFVPAEVVPGSADRRILGCWVEIVNPA